MSESLTMEKNPLVCNARALDQAPVHLSIVIAADNGGRIVTTATPKHFSCHSHHAKTLFLPFLYRQKHFLVTTGHHLATPGHNLATPGHRLATTGHHLATPGNPKWAASGQKLQPLHSGATYEIQISHPFFSGSGRFLTLSLTTTESFAAPGQGG